MTCKCCGSPINVGSGPFYDEVEGQVLQNHETVLQDTVYAAGLVIKESFNIPALTEDVPVKLTKVYNIVVGSYLFNPAYGYLQISNYNPNTNTIGLLNDGVKGTAVPGTFVSENTIFIVTNRPCCEDDSATLFPFVAEDFEVPVVSGDVTIEVTSTFGLRLGELVRIGSGLFRLDTVNSSKQIVVTNEGAGGTPGTVVEALDANRDYQYLITAELASACAATAEVLGRLIICTGSDEHILGGTHAGQVPVLQNAGDDTVAFEFLDAEVRTCTELTAALDITSGIGVYPGVAVDDTTGFTTGDLLQINFSSLRFEVTAIGAGTLDLETIPNPPGVNITIIAGSAVCKYLTTEDLQDQIDALNTSLDGTYVRVDGTNAAGIVGTAWLANDAVTFAKMQNIATDRLVGRDTAASGDVEELTVTGGLEFTGSGGIRRSALTGDVTAAAGSNATTIANDAVTTAKILNAAVTTAKLHQDAATRSCALLRLQLVVSDGSVNTLMNADGLDIEDITMPRPGTITYLSLNIGNNLTGGTVTLWVFKNGVNTGLGAVFSPTDKNFTSPTGAWITFVAGDEIGLRLDTAAATFTGGGARTVAHVWGHFTS